MGRSLVQREHRHRDAGGRWPALVLIVALHAGALWGLMQIESVRAAVQTVAPIMVGLITLPPPEVPPPKIETPPPKPAPVRPRPEPRMIVAEMEAPAAIEAAVPETAPAEETPPAPEPEPAAPPPITPPNFVAAYLDNPPPAYPASSRRLTETGTVTLRVRVSAEGRADAVEIAQSSGFARLDRAAIDAVRRWKFVPAKQGDQAVPAVVLVPINFDLSRT